MTALSSRNEANVAQFATSNDDRFDDLCSKQRSVMSNADGFPPQLLQLISQPFVPFDLLHFITNFDGSLSEITYFIIMYILTARAGRP